MTSRRRGGAASRVEVCEGTGGLELRVDGTFASFYRPGSVLTGSVWDAIAAPILALPEARRRSVLLLGLGGGSAARIVRAVAPDAHIVGVEFDAEVVEVARRAFDLDRLDLEIVIDDARRFLAEDRRRFDIILEDIFVGEGDGVHKPDWLPLPGHELAMPRLAKGGMLVSNTLDEAAEVGAVLRRLFPSTVRIDVEDYDNLIFAGGPEPLNARSLRAAVAASPVLCATLPNLHFRSLGGTGSGVNRRGTAQRRC